MSASARAHHNLIHNKLLCKKKSVTLKCVFALINVPNPGADDILMMMNILPYTGHIYIYVHYTCDPAYCSYYYIMGVDSRYDDK